MGLFEFIGEIYNPGPVGTVDFEKRLKDPKPNYLLFKFLVSIILLVVLEFVYATEFNAKNFLIVNGITLFYLFCAYKINITPNYQNTGWVPFIIDNPFRYSDDINRLSIFFMVILWPGKFLSTSIINYYYHKKNTLTN